MRAIVVMLALAQGGCLAELGGKLNSTVVEPATAEHEGLEVIETPSGEVIETLPALGAPDTDQCWVRAKYFHGLVRVSCETVARQIAP